MRIVIDTREKIPWSFQFNDLITGTVNTKLDFGDYAIEGHEELVAIERKRNILEIAENFTTDRFWRAIDRLEEAKHPLIVFEFSLDHIYRYPNVHTIPNNLKAKLKLTPQYLISKLGDLMCRRINIIFADNTVYAEKIANDFLCKIIKKYQLC